MSTDKLWRLCADYARRTFEVWIMERSSWMVKAVVMLVEVGLATITNRGTENAYKKSSNSGSDSSNILTL